MEQRRFGGIVLGMNIEKKLLQKSVKSFLTGAIFLQLFLHLIFVFAPLVSLTKSNWERVRESLRRETGFKHLQLSG